ncbi:hypothetical protein [Streptomyces sp. NPDC004285]
MITTSAPPIFDVDDDATWPQQVGERVQVLADHVRRSVRAPENYQSLEIGSEEETVLGLLEGYLVRARHSTHLLDHEKDALRAQGLRMLTRGLVNGRLDQAHELGYLTTAEYEALSTANETVPERRRRGVRREDQVCLTLATAPMTHDVDGLYQLLSYWGGEAIYWQHCEGNPDLAEKLRSLGAPAIVTALLDFTAPGAGAHRIFPSMVHVLVGKALGHEPADADVLYRASIPPQRIESIVSPGHPEYDRFAGLPTA